MTKATFDMILSNQMPDAEKRAKADYVIPTVDLDETRQAVDDLMTTLRAKYYA